MAFGHNLAELCVAVVIELLHVGGNSPWIFGVAAKIANCHGIVGARFAQGLSVSGALVFEVFAGSGDCAETHHGVADDECGALGLGLGGGYCRRDFVGIVAVDFDHVPVPRAVFCGYILVGHFVDHGGELHAVGVVEHDEIAQSEEAGEATGTLADFLLDAAVGDESISLMGNHVAETGLQETLADGAAYGHGVTLAERTGGVFHAAGGVELGMSRGH